MPTSLIILVGTILVLAILIVSIYNGLIRRRNEVDNAFGGMDAQLKKRYDLLPNLIETVKQYAQHEKDVLTNLTSLRTKATSTDLSMEEKVALDNQISSGMGQLMVAVENYPDLKANENFVMLQRSLNEIESQISAARRSYNAAVTHYNNGIETFPNNLLAPRMNMGRKEIFTIPDVERQYVDVKKYF